MRDRMDVVIRRATIDDVAAVHAVAAATFPLACPPGSTAADQRAFIDEHLSEATFATHLADPNRAIFVDEVDGPGGQLTGYTMLVVAEPTDDDVTAALAASALPQAGRAELSKCYTLPSTHGTGVAGALMAATLAEAAARGIRTVWLGVNQENGRARRFYEKHGFAVVGTKRFLVGERLEHDFVLAHEMRAPDIHSME